MNWLISYSGTNLEKQPTILFPILIWHLLHSPLLFVVLKEWTLEVKKSKTWCEETYTLLKFIYKKHNHGHQKEILRQKGRLTCAVWAVHFTEVRFASFLSGGFQGCIKCIRLPAMDMDQIEFFCPFPDWLKNKLNVVFVTNPKTEILKSKDLNALQDIYVHYENWVKTSKKNLILIATRSFSKFGNLSW